jgi:hypothetical protein
MRAGFLRDVWGYTFIILVINLLVLCRSKGIILAPGVRGSLSRAFTIGVRLETLTRRSRKPIQAL